MNRILYISCFIAAILIFTSPCLFAHYGPRGLLGGSPHVGIQYNGNVYLGTEDAGVFESTNTTLTGWRLRSVGLKSGHITALAHTGAELYAASDSGVFIFNGIVGSDRYWVERNTGLGSIDVKALLAIDANTLFAGTGANGLYKTTDKGLNWTAVSSSVLNGKDISALTMGGSRLFALVRNGGVFASDDNGTTWFDLNDVNTLNKTASAYFSYNSTNNQLLVSNTDGLFVLSSAGTTIAPSYTAASSGLPTQTHIHGLTNNGGKWFVASHSGLFQTAASSVSWASASTGISSTAIGVVVAIDDTLIAGVEKAGMYKSDANTVSWSVINTGMTNINTYSLACKGDSTVLTATEYGVTLSTNIGNNPVIINNGLTDSLGVNDVEIAENLFVAATGSAGVFISSNSGQLWTAQNTGLSNMDISRVIYGNNRIYAIDADGKIFQSDLPTISWTQITNGLPSAPAATSLAFFANNLVLGTYGNGVFIKNRDSATWTAFNTGLSNMNVTSVTYSAGKFYAGTDGSGVWVSNAATAGWSAAAPIALPHLSNVPFLKPGHIQYMTTVREYVIASYKGGIAGSTDGGASWVPAGNQFNLPSYSNINKVSYVTSRVFLTTETNNAHSGGTAELDFTDSLLVVNDAHAQMPAAASVSYHSITSNVKWKVVSSDNWVTLSVDSGFWNKDLKLNIAANTAATPRIATVTITGDTMTRTIMVYQDGVTGIRANIENTGGVRLYPNPSNGSFTITFDGDLKAQSVSISDVAGKQLMEIAVDNKQSLSIAGEFVPGLYFVRIHAKNGDIVQKMIVQ